MLRLQDIMTRDVVTVSPELSLRDAMELFTSLHISGAPVVSRGRVVGVISLTDLAELAATTPGVPTERSDRAELDEFEYASDWREGEAPPAAYFAELWEDSGADVVERMAESMGLEWNTLEEHTVAEAMSGTVAALPADATVEQAAEVMRRAAIHRILVMENGDLLGLVTTSDITDAVADRRLTKHVYVFGSRAGQRGARRSST